MAMTILRVTLCALLMVMAVTSKPISDELSDSDESNDSEEAASHAEPSQGPQEEPVAGTEVPVVVEETGPAPTEGLPPPASDIGPSTAALDASGLPTEGPQPSIDAPPSSGISGAALGPDSPPDPAQDSAHAAATAHETEVSPQPEMTGEGIFMGSDATAPPQVFEPTAGYQWPHQGAAPPSLPQHVNPTLPPVSVTPSLLVPVAGAVTAGPVCLTFQFHEPIPLRGDM